MGLFGRESDAARALKACNDELRRMHKLLSDDHCLIGIDVTKTELMDRIIKLQDTLNEGARRLCGLEILRRDLIIDNKFDDPTVRDVF